jgi:intracellular sulfur oxidation DsrE/DsrF family protein
MQCWRQCGSDAAIATPSDFRQGHAMRTTSRRQFTVQAIALLAAAWLPQLGAAQLSGASPRQRVVFQVSDAEPVKWSLALNNIRNIQDDLGGSDAVDIELVAYGPGIGILKSDSPMAQRVAEVLKAGVKVVACENTMRSQKLVHADMLPDIGYVPAGVVELMRKQQQGYAYIRP